jgi:subtilisin-like proprotein convertase family protein
VGAFLSFGVVQSFMKLNALKLWLLLLCVSSPLLARGNLLSFSNTNSITINDSAVLPTLATPYPSTIQVTGLTGLVITKATVTLHQLSHTFPSDIHLLLVSPQNRAVVLMSETGGQDKFSVTNLVITLDDDAAQPLPILQSLQSGVFRPNARQIPIGFAFPSPAPGTSSNYLYRLSAFKGTDPTGTWRLFAIDYGAGDAGSIAGGWTLNLNISVPLKIALSPPNIVLSWPVSAGNSILQSATNTIAPANWSVEPIDPLIQAGQYFVTNSLSSGKKYYRLIQ